MIAVVSTDSFALPDFMSGLARDLADLQLRQYRHDSDYHRDIVNLPPQGQMKHLTLHFSKYCGRMIAENEFKPLLESAYVQSLVDTFVISLAMANLMADDLSAGWDTYQHEVSMRPFSQTMVILTGKLAKLCEGLDHLEYLSYRDATRAHNRQLLVNLIMEFDRFHLPYKELYHARLNQVEAKNIFHYHLQKTIREAPGAASVDPRLAAIRKFDITPERRNVAYHTRYTEPAKEGDSVEFENIILKQDKDDNLTFIFPDSSLLHVEIDEKNRKRLIGYEPYALRCELEGIILPEGIGIQLTSFAYPNMEAHTVPRKRSARNRRKDSR